MRFRTCSCGPSFSFLVRVLSPAACVWFGLVRCWELGSYLHVTESVKCDIFKVGVSLHSAFLHFYTAVICICP